MHGHDDRADGCSGEQQGDNLKREHVATHQRIANVVYRDCGNCRLIAADALTLWSTAQPSTEKTAAAITRPASQLRL